MMSLPRRGEEGSALIATILIVTVVLTLGAVALQTATHTEDATTLDRLRVQSMQAAEAAVSDAINRLQSNGACDAAVSSPANLTDGSRTIAKYQVRVDPEVGTLCDTYERVVHAWGYAPVSTSRSMRKLEVGVKLVPQDGFHYVIFAAGSQGTVEVKNNGLVDGDVYAENLDQTKNNIDAGTVITTGDIDTKNNAVYLGNLWAGGNVTVRQNGQVGGSITAAGSSSAGNVTLENGVIVNKDVKAKGTVSLGGTTVVHGSVSQNNGYLPPPPDLQLPAFTWDPSNYTPAPLTFPTAAAASTHLLVNRNALQGTIYVSDASGTVDFTNGGTVTGPLTIVTEGKVSFGGTLSGGDYQVVVVSRNSGIDAISADKAVTAGVSLDLLLYTTGTISIKNMTGFTGSIYANKIELKNGFSVSRSDSLANTPPAGFDFTQSSAFRYTVVPIIWREVTPTAP